MTLFPGKHTVSWGLLVLLELTRINHLLSVVLDLVSLESFGGVAGVIARPATLESLVFGGRTEGI